MDELNRLLSKLLGPDGEVSPEVLRQIADIGPRAGPALVRALLDSQRHNAAAAAIEHLPELTLEHLAQRLQGNPCGAENEECRLAGCFAISAIIVEMWELAKAEERQEVLARLSNFAVTALLREPARGCSAGRAAKHRVLLDMGWDLLPALEAAFPDYPWQTLREAEQGGKAELARLIAALQTAQQNEFGSMLAALVFAEKGVVHLGQVASAVWSDSPALHQPACAALLKIGADAAMVLVEQMEAHAGTPAAPGFRRAADLLRTLVEQVKNLDAALQQTLELGIVQSAACREVIERISG